MLQDYAAANMGIVALEMTTVVQAVNQALVLLETPMGCLSLTLSPRDSLTG